MPCEKINQKEKLSVVLRKFSFISQRYHGHSYRFGNWVFGRFLGLVTLFAFLSYWVQADALVGPQGLVPWEKDLANIEQLTEKNKEISKFSLRPTLLWFQPLANHDLIFATGTLAATLLTLGLLPLISVTVSYITYLSLMVVGGPFLNFQWDILLTETLFISAFFLPNIKFHGYSDHCDFPRLGRYLLIGLLAKLMLESGIVKFTYFTADGFNSWRELTALSFHYWTQPLPHSWSPWVDALPHWFDQISLTGMYAVELILPFLFFLPGNLRRIGLVGQIILQIAILASGNFGFFNFLTLCLCIPLIDDQFLPKQIRQKFSRSKDEDIQSGFSVRTAALVFLSFIFLTTTYGHLLNDFRGNQSAQDHPHTVPEWIKDLQTETRIFRSFNSYGLFRVMTTTRPEIIIEGSLDGISWQPYQFKWKPSLETQKLHFTGPHMPRIDWQMWFEGLNFQNYLSQPFARFLYGRFLQLSIEGKSMADFYNLPLVLGDQKFQALQQAPLPIQKQAISNFNYWMQSFLSRSFWFGSFLRSLGEGRSIILTQLSDSNPVDFQPRMIRVSLQHFQFSSKEDQTWDITEIPNANYLLQVPSLNSAYTEKP